MPLTDSIAPDSQAIGQLSPTRFPSTNTQTAQVEPPHFHQAESKGTLDTVKSAAQQAAQQTVEFAKHIPENIQHSAQATADFVKQIPEKVRGTHGADEVQEHSAQATASEAATIDQLSPTHFSDVKSVPAQVEPTHLHEGEAKGALDTVKMAAQQAAQQSVEFAKHIPENMQHGAQAAAGFVKQIPEKVRGMHIPEGVQHGAQATLDFVKHIPENVQHGAHATAGFVKQHLPSGAATTTEKTGLITEQTVATEGAAAPSTPATDLMSPDTQEYLKSIGRSDGEGMHVHTACGAARNMKVPEHIHQQH